MNLKTVPSDYA